MSDTHIHFAYRDHEGVVHHCKVAIADAGALITELTERVIAYEAAVAQLNAVQSGETKLGFKLD